MAAHVAAMSFLIIIPSLDDFFADDPEAQHGTRSSPAFTCAAASRLRR
jgi:hypothetical protein